MCGITGIVDFKGVSGQTVGRAMELMAHRGPDAQGVFYGEHCILGHLRLSILDLSESANQPMYSHCGRYIMVYNGEIFNFREITDEIKLANPAFHAKTNSDSEIILEAFALWGKDFVQRLNGMFAIAIWDKHLECLSLLRDRVGIKPLYYYLHKGVLAFSSELKGLAGNNSIKETLSIDPVAINQFLHLGFIPAPASIYKEIKKLPPGFMGTFSRSGLTTEQYWDIRLKINEKPLDDVVRAKEELKALIESSVRYRMISDVPLGTFLSGGIDSSLVTAVAQSVHSEPVNTFNIGFWEKGFDESAYASAVANYLGTRHHNFQVTEKDALEWMPRLNDIYDEPFADSSAIPTLLVSRMARQQVTVTLSGDGGDELFMGYGAYKWAERLQSPWIKAMGGFLAFLVEHGPGKYRRAAPLFNKIDPELLKSHIFSQEQYLFSRKLAHQALNRNYHDGFSLDENFSTLSRKLTASEQQAMFDFLYYLPDDLLVKVDRASMFFALETRVPLLDYRIVEWAMNLSPKLKMQHGDSKWLLKQILFDYVPASYFNRPKRGFAIPLQKWLQKELGGFVQDFLNLDSINKSGILNPVFVNRLLDDFYKKGHLWQYNKIWQLLVLQKWLLENQS